MIPTVLLGTDGGCEGRSRPYRFSYDDYIEALTAVGCAVVLVPWQDEEALRQLVSSAQGLVIPGGDDLCFSDRLAEETPVQAARQQADSILIDEATRLGLPVLGVCYGMQLMNHLAGGTLDRHLESAAAHQNGVNHGLRSDSGWLPESWNQASYHHQGIRELGQGLNPCVWADDGLIEGFFHKNRNFWMGFQWHLEKRESAADEVILRQFSEACTKDRC